MQLPTASSVSEFFGQFTTPNFSAILNADVWIVGATIAVVASIETLLCLEAGDKMDPYKRLSSANAELKAQGVGNVLAGLIGGLPMTSVIVRTTANINAADPGSRADTVGERAAVSPTNATFVPCGRPRESTESS